jgi:hypothetical protein
MTNIGEIDAVGVVDETVEDGGGIGWVADHGMPFVDWDLAGKDGRAAAVAFLQDLVEIVAGASVERFEAPIVEGQQLNPGEAAQDPCIAAIAAGQRRIGEQLGDTLIEHPAGLSRQTLWPRAAGQSTLADAGGPAQDQIVVRVDPFAAGELLEQGAVEAARCTAIDVLHDGVLAEPGIAQAGGQALIATMGDLTIEKQLQPVGVIERRGVAAGR